MENSVRMAYVAFALVQAGEWWEGKNICYRSLGIFYMVCQVIKGHALLLERVWGEFCNILNCTLLCDISEEHYIFADNFCSLYATG